MPEIFMTCPFCRERRSNISLTSEAIIKPDEFGFIHREASLRALGTCYLCKNVSIVFLSAISPSRSPHTIRDICNQFQKAQRSGENLEILRWQIVPLQTYPPLSPHHVPSNLPAFVQAALEEAHANASDKRWRSAVMGYATALEFACSDLLQGENSSDPLGRKLKALKGKAQLPQALLDFMEIVNLDRRAAGHYTEPVTEEACHAARVLAVTTLEYLYSLPAEIDAAQRRLSAAKGEA